jgi:hypothetical protein
MPHVDRAGVVTTVTCHTGQKMWLSWPSQSLDDLKAFGFRGKSNGKGFCIFLQLGDTLVQPASTVHAPYTLELCFMSGNMFTPAQNVDRQLECLEAEAWMNLSITNEDPARETFDKLNWWLQMINDSEQGAPSAWPWPDQTGQDKFRASLEVRPHYSTLSLLC